MASRTRHPLKSMFLFLIVVGVGYFAYQNRHLITNTREEILTQDERKEIREQVVEEFQKFPGFYTVRSMSWRPREQRYHLDIEVSDDCENAKEICNEIAEYVREHADVTATVIAADSTGRELGRAVL